MSKAKKPQHTSCESSHDEAEEEHAMDQNSFHSDLSANSEINNETVGEINEMAIDAEEESIVETNDVNMPILLERRNEFTCGICLEVTTEPTFCVHCNNDLFCVTCLTHALQTSRSCPICRTVGPQTPTVSRYVRKAIDAVWSRCPHSGCTFEETYDKVSVHMVSCVNRIIECPNSEHGCKMSHHQKTIAIHAQHCKYRTIKCKCGHQFKWKDRDQHLRACDAVDVTCEKCNNNFSRKALEKHLLECAMIEIPCSYALAGCTWMGMRKDHDKHCQTCKFKKFAAMVSSLKSLSQENALLKQQLGVLKLQNLLRAKGCETTISFASPYEGGLKGVHLLSNSFSCEGMKWNIMFYPFGPLNSKSNQSGVYLKLSETKHMVAWVSFSLKLDNHVFFRRYYPLEAGRNCGKCFTNPKAFINNTSSFEVTVQLRVMKVIMFQDEFSKSAYSHRLKELRKGRDATGMLAQQRCSYLATAETKVKQNIRRCRTCNDIKVCDCCARKCHAHHDLSPVIEAVAFCSCGQHSHYSHVDCLCVDI